MNDSIQSAPVDSNNTPVSPAPTVQKPVDTYSYRGWLVSDLFYKRAFAVLGHYIVAQLMIALAIASLCLLVILLGIVVF
jgi:hypothetical protein